MNLQVDSVDEIEKVGKAMLSKQLWMDAAECFDAWRVVPRSVLGTLLALTAKIDTTMVLWFIHIPDGARTAADAIAVTSVVTVVTSLLTVAIKFYLDTGRNWTKTDGP